MSLFFYFGARDAKLVETDGKKLTVHRDLLASWKLPPVDLKVLEKEHFSLGIPIEKLAKQYQRSPITVQQYIRKIRRKRDYERTYQFCS